jgi:tRNA pseudouridine55 synthase
MKCWKLLRSLYRHYTAGATHSFRYQGGREKRVYELARKGIDVKLEPRQITISEFSITKVELPVVHFKVVCSTGTYIRSLANDFGAQLGCGGHLSSLCRTRIGDFSLKDAMTIEDLEDEIKALRKDT